MHNQSSMRVVSTAFFMTCIAFCCQNADAQGWLQRSTGIRTPDPIRKIAPNGVSRKQPQESTSHLSYVTPSSIDKNGNVYSGTDNSGQSNRIVAKATITYNSKGEAYWTYSGRYGNPPPVRKPDSDRRPAKLEVLGREASDDIEFDNRVQKKKQTKKPSVSQNGRPQNGLTQQQREEAELAKAISQLLQGMTQNQGQNRP